MLRPWAGAELVSPDHDSPLSHHQPSVLSPSTCPHPRPKYRTMAACRASMTGRGPRHDLINIFFLPHPGSQQPGAARPAAALRRTSPTTPGRRRMIGSSAGMSAFARLADPLSILSDQKIITECRLGSTRILEKWPWRAEALYQRIIAHHHQAPASAGPAERAPAHHSSGHAGRVWGLALRFCVTHDPENFSLSPTWPLQHRVTGCSGRRGPPQWRGFSPALVRSTAEG